MQLQLAPLIGAGTRGGGEGARLYTAMAAVTVMFSPHREINGTVLDHRLHARAAERSLLVSSGMRVAPCSVRVAERALLPWVVTRGIAATLRGDVARRPGTDGL